MSFEEFLRFEERSNDKHEFHQGLVVLMPGVTLEHSLCTTGVVRELSLLARGSKCLVLSSDMGILVEGGEDEFVYPDAAILCGKPKFWNRNNRVLTNPKLVVEVLSLSTRDYDMSGKFSRYCRLASFDEYLLLESTSAVGHHWLKDSFGKWQRKKYAGHAATLPIRTLGRDLRLGDIYEGVPGINSI